MNYYSDEPIDYAGTYFVRTVYNAKNIINTQRLVDRFVSPEKFLSDAEILEDWIICNWAEPTDMPVGTYVNKWHHKGSTA
jgi:hypothetical protein